MVFIKHILLFISLVFSLSVQAETLLHNASFFSSQTLTQQKSPYRIQKGLIVQPGVTLTIEKGVKLIFDQGNIFIRKGGQLILRGTEELPIELENISSDDRNAMIAGDKADIQLQHIHIYSTSQPFLQAWNYSTVSLSHVSKETYGREGTGSKQFISLFLNSSTTIDHLELNHWRGIGVQVFQGSNITITNSVFENITKAMEIFDAKASIHTSDFEENDLSLDSWDAEVDARENWWGSVAGPGDSLRGDALYDPWSATPHKKRETTCCSNILFLPGLMGSRLYKNGGFLENQLWEPNRNTDVKKLFMNAEGKSIESGIYTRDIIEKSNIAGGVSLLDQDIYSQFVTTIQNLVKEKKINNFSLAPYDWRYSPDTILEEGIVAGSKENRQLKSLVDIAKNSAADSKTKKVSLVSHSNGGLVAKQLLIELKKQKLDSLVDRVIFVAMPEFGTPQAITALLFGHDQSIGKGLVLKSNVAKQLGQNMPTAYTLMPSQKYFENQPLGIKFAGTTLANKLDLSTKLSSFGHINQDLLRKAEQLHSSLDSWIPHKNTVVFQLLGTNIPTVSGLISLSGKKKFLPEYSLTGDGVVQTGQGRTGKVSVFDLKDSVYKHVNIMNNLDVIKKIKDIVLTGDQTTISFGQPVSSNMTYKLLQIGRSEQASTTNLLPKGFQIESTYTVDPNPIPTSKYKYDKYTAGYSQYFDSVSEQSNANRFSLFDNDVHYLYMNDPKTVVMSDGNNTAVDISLFEKEQDALTELSYSNVTSVSGAHLAIGGGGLTITIPLVDQVITIDPTEKTRFDNNGQVIEKQVFATTTETVEEKVARLKGKIESANLTAYLKPRYIRMLDIYMKNKEAVYLESVQARVARAIASINRFGSSGRLANQYKKLKQDYIYLSYILAQ